MDWRGTNTTKPKAAPRGAAKRQARVDPKTYTISLRVEPRGRLWPPRLPRRLRAPMIAVVAILVMLGGIGSYSFTGEADVAMLYPETCLGGWQNPRNAEGAPDLAQSASLTEYSEDNAAVLKNVATQLYCGRFTGKSADDTRPTQVTLRLSWAVADDAPVLISGENIESSVEEILDAPDDAQFVASTSAAVATTSATSSVPSAGERREKDTRGGGSGGGAQSAEEQRQAAAAAQSSVRAPSTSTSTQSPDEGEATTSTATTSKHQQAASDEAHNAATNDGEDAPMTTTSDGAVQSQDSKSDTSSSATQEKSNEQADPTPKSREESAQEEKAEEVVPVEQSESASQDTSQASVQESAPKEEDGAKEASNDAGADESGAEEQDAAQQEDVADEQARALRETLNALFAHTAYAQEQATSAANSTGTPARNPSDFLELSYTLDGETWHRIGTVNRENWRFAEFALPLESWQQLERVQIGITTLPSIDDMPTVYLDGMWLEVAYEEAPLQKELSPDEQDLLRDVPRTQDAQALKLQTTRRDFRADEAVELEFLLSTTSAAAASTTTAATTSTQVSNTTSAPQRSPQERMQGATSSQQEAALPAAEIPTSTPLHNEAASSSATGTPQQSEAAGQMQEEQATTTAGASTSTASTAIGAFVSHARAIWNRLKPPTPQASAQAPQPRVVSTRVFGPRGRKLAIAREVRFVTPERLRITIPKPERRFTPGRYRLEIDTLTNGVLTESVQEFTWGVLAINFDKTIYTKGEEAYIQMAALNSAGHTRCDADLELVVTAPDRSTERFAVGDSTLIANTSCARNNVTDEPDYYVRHTLAQTGTYEFVLRDRRTNYTIEDSVEVRVQVPFVIERAAATRINPFEAKYRMRIRVTALEPFDGVIAEQMPASFQVTEHSGDPDERASGKARILAWDATLAAGETIEYTYTYQAPKVSPQFYLLGPLTLSKRQGFWARLFGPQSQERFAETRQWQLAADAVLAIDPDGDGLVTDATPVSCEAGVSDDTNEFDCVNDGTRDGDADSGDGYLEFTQNRDNSFTMSTLDNVDIATSVTVYVLHEETGTNMTFDILLWEETESTQYDITRSLPNRNGAVTWDNQTFDLTGDDGGGLDQTELNNLRIELLCVKGTGPGNECRAYSFYADVAHTRTCTNVTYSGTAYTDEGQNALDGSGTPKTVTVYTGGSATSSEITTSNGAWSNNGVCVADGSPVSVYLDDETEKANTVFLSDGTGEDTIDLYQNRLIARASSSATTSPITSIDLGNADSGDTDLLYSTSSSDLIVAPGTELHVWQDSVFAPDGAVTIRGNGQQNALDGSLHLGASSTLRLARDITLAGFWMASSSSRLVHGTSTMIFNATTTGKQISIEPSYGANLGPTSFTGVGGEWTFSGNASTTGAFTITNGTVIAPSLLTLIGGNFTNNGTFTAGSGTMYFDALTRQIGSDHTLGALGTPALAALNSTDVAFIDASNDDLRTYRFDGASWARIDDGTSAVTGAGNPALAALTNADVAFVDSANGDLRTYRFDGASWAQIDDGTSNIAGIGTPALAALNSTDVAFIDASNDDLRTYRFDGASWSLVGSELNLPGAGSHAIAALNGTDIALIESGTNNLRTYRFDGTNWSRIGNSTNIAAVNGPSLSALNSTDVAFLDSGDVLRTYRFDGSNWSQIGTTLNIASVSTHALASLTTTDIAHVSTNDEDLRTYRVVPDDHTLSGALTGANAFDDTVFLSHEANSWTFLSKASTSDITLRSATTTVNSAGMFSVAGNLTINGAPVSLEDTLEDGLKGYWTMDHLGPNVRDQSGRGNHGNLDLGASGKTATTTAPGRIGRAMEFDGTDDFIDLSNTNLDPETYSSFTLTAWYKSATTSVGDDHYFYRHYNAAIDQISFAATNDTGDEDTVRLLLEASDGGVQQHYGTTDVVDELWHHVAAVRDAQQGRVRIYVDGALDADLVDGTSGADISINATGPFIGGDQGSNQLTGFLDDVRYYNRVLATSTIVSLYDLGANGKFVAATGTTYLAGNHTNNGLFVHNYGTTTFNGALAQTATGTMAGAQRFHNVSFTGAGTKDFGANASTSDFTIESGSGDVSAPPLLTVLGNYSNSATFTAGSGEVVFHASSSDVQTLSGTMTGSSAFNDVRFTGTSTKQFNANASTSALTIADVSTTVNAPGMLTVGGDLTITGSSITLEDTLEDGLVGYWTMDHIGPNVRDKSGMGNHGNLILGSSGNTSTSTAIGRIGQAMEFDGVDDRVIVPHDAAFNITGDITIAAWFKLQDPSADNDAILSKDDAAGSAWDYELIVEGNGSDTLFFYGDGMTPSSVSGNTAITDTDWHHGVAVRSGDTVSFYLDGEADGSSSMTGSFNTNSYDIHIGDDFYDPSNNEFTGLLDDVRIYDRALSAAEIQSLYDIGVGGKLVAATGTTYIAGNHTQNGIFVHNYGTTTFNGTAGTQTIAGDLVGARRFHNVSFTGTGTKDFGANASTSDFTIESGSGDVSAPALLTLLGNYTNSATFTAGTGEVVFHASSSDAQTMGGTMTGSSAFNDVRLTGTSTKQFNANASTSALTIGEVATLTAPAGFLSIAGNYTNNGTFLHNNGTTTFNGTSAQTATGTMTGTSTFFGLEVTNTAATTTFGAAVTASSTFRIDTSNVKMEFLGGATSTFEHVYWDGISSGNEINLFSTNAGTQWGLDVPGNRTVEYVRVKDSNACSGNPNISALNSINVQNNNCWDFSAGSLTFTITTSNFGNLFPGSPIFATSTLHVSTDNAAGWNVTAYGNSVAGSDTEETDQTMDLNSDASVNITDLDPQWIPGAATTSAGNAVSIAEGVDALAFRVMAASGTQQFLSTDWWGSGDSPYTTARWAGFASSTAADLRIGESSGPTTGTAHNTVQYYLDVPASQQTGTYAGTTTFTATPN